MYYDNTHNQAMNDFDQYQEHVKEVHGKKGDVVIFTETLTHGTLPLTNGEHECR